jgi:hypothetical protein
VLLRFVYISDLIKVLGRDLSCEEAVQMADGTDIGLQHTQHMRLATALVMIFVIAGAGN